MRENILSAKLAWLPMIFAVTLSSKITSSTRYFDSFVAGRWLIYIHLLVWFMNFQCTWCFFSHFFPHDQRKSHYNAGSWGEYANGPVTKAQVKANKLTKAGLVQLLSTPHYDKKKWKKHERGNIFAEDYALWFWCLQNMFSSIYCTAEKAPGDEVCCRSNMLTEKQMLTKRTRWHKMARWALLYVQLTLAVSSKGHLARELHNWVWKCMESQMIDSETQRPDQFGQSSRIRETSLIHGPCWSSFFWIPGIRESRNPFADSKVHQHHHGGPNHGDVAWLCGYAAMRIGRKLVVKRRFSGTATHGARIRIRCQCVCLLFVLYSYCPCQNPRWW